MAIGIIQPQLGIYVKLIKIACIERIRWNSNFTGVRNMIQYKTDSSNAGIKYVTIIRQIGKYSGCIFPSPSPIIHLPPTNIMLYITMITYKSHNGSPWNSVGLWIVKAKVDNICKVQEKVQRVRKCVKLIINYFSRPSSPHYKNLSHLHPSYLYQNAHTISRVMSGQYYWMPSWCIIWWS